MFPQFHMLMQESNKTPSFQQQHNHHPPQLQHQFSMPSYTPSTPGPCNMSPLDAVLSCNNNNNNNNSGSGSGSQDSEGSNGSGNR